ncbi:MAG: TonB-dependent receptor [Tannerella sp.]|jgi:TonB-linked SusC/RagA family outer membrane protein|nr:TonB-dependent receptor [Tannerella sp.]
MKQIILKKKRKIRIIEKLCFLTCLFMCLSSAYSQKTVTGKVTDTRQEALPGVTVMLKEGTQTNGTATDMDGNYSIVVSSDDSALEFSYLGYKSQSVTVGNRTVVNIVMEENYTALDEIVVVGYGVQKKLHLTGSVSQITSKEIVKVPAPNVTHTLVGKLPGLMSSQNNGAPGADGVTFQIRGLSSWTATSPFVLVDGIERDFSNIDPNDIESVVLLKDGAAAVYGFKAASGVILITTKRGTQEELRPAITYSGSASFSRNTKLPKFMNGTEYMQWYNKARELDGLEPKFTEEEIAMTQNGDPTDGYENTNWMSPMEKSSPMHQHNIQIRGSSKNIRYFLSGGFKDQRGFFRDFKHQTTNLRSNIDVDATKDITVSLDIGATLVRYYRPGANSYSNQEYNNIVGVMMYALPFIPKEYNGYPASGYRGGANPEYARDHSGFHKTDNNIVRSKANFEFRVPGIKGLKTSFLMAYDFADSDGMTFSYAYKLYQYNFSSKSYQLTNAMSLMEDGNMYAGRNRSSKTVIRPSINYADTFEDHDITALFLLERTENRESSIAGTRSGFVLFENPELDFGAPSGSTYTNSGSSSKTVMAGWVGQFNYSYASRYLAEFAFRYDGSYKFAPKYRWGFFPAASVGWLISEESFFKNTVSGVNKLKIRASAAKLGNDNTPQDLWRRLYVAGTSAPVTFGGADYKIISNNNTYLATDITWAKTETYNAGLEFSLWNGLLSGEGDVFYKYTYDILQDVASVYPPSLGGNYPQRENSGEFEAKGFELQLKHSNVVRNFRYDLTGNVSYATNKILSRNQAENILPWQDRIGSSVGDIWGYRAIGLARTQEDLDNAPIPPTSSLRPLELGDILYDDVNGDGKIDSKDMVKIAGASMPKMMFSLTADLFFKGFDLSAQFQGAAITDKMLCGTWENGANDNTPLTRPFYGNSDNTPLYLIEGSWRPDNPDGKYPRLSSRADYGKSGLLSSFWKVDGSYLRLKQLTLGYTLSQRHSAKIGLNNLRLYVAATNLFTLTSFEYLDPESPNVLQGYYPQQRTVSVGLNIAFK